MNYGLQISASGAMTAFARQDILSNNLANLETTGFKPSTVFTQQREAVRQEDDLPLLDSNAMLERLGADALLAPVRTVFSQGPLEETGNPLDLAVQGEGFFAVQQSGPDGDAVRFTRDGRLTINDDTGELIMATTGLPVLDTASQPIRITGDGPVAIDAEGTIRQNGAPVARLGLFDVADRNQLNKLGANLFDLRGATPERVDFGTGRVRSGFLEGSSVNELGAIMQITAAGRAVSTNIEMVSYHDQMLSSAIGRFARSA